MKKQYEIWNQGRWQEDVASSAIMGGYCNGTTFLGFDIVRGQCISTPEGKVRCAKCETLLDKHETFYGGKVVHRIHASGGD